jgi:hypothetical protein
MADDDPDRLSGSSCTATIDWAARTLTFDHRGWFRISRRDHEPWTGGVASDPHGMNCAVDPTEFANRVRTAAGIASAAPDPEPAVEQEVPKQEDGEVVKAVDGALDFLSKWN